MPCGENKWNNHSGSHDQEDCKLCEPDSSTRGVLNASNRAQCVCDAGYFDNSTLSLADAPDCGP